MSPLATGLAIALTATLSLASAALRPPAPRAPALERCPSVAACTFSASATALGRGEAAIEAWNLLSKRVALSLSKRDLRFTAHAPVVPYAGNLDPAAVRSTRSGATLAFMESQPAYEIFPSARRERATSVRVVPVSARPAPTNYGGFPDF